MEVTRQSKLETLEQKYFYEQRICSIEKKGVKLRIKSIADDLERFIPFEEISKVTKTKKSGNLLYILFAAFPLGLLIAYLIEERGFELSGTFFFNMASTTIIISILIGVYIKESVPFKCLKCDNSEIQLFYNKVNKDNVDKFIPKLIEARSSYYKNKYLQKDESISYEMYLRRIRWLMEDGIIDNQEYEYLKEQHIKQTDNTNEIQYGLN
jgi:hypothetical protein